MLNILKFVFIICVFYPTVTRAGELPPWTDARHTILECYGGWDLEISVSGGYEHRVYDSGPVDGEFANALISVPIYSRKQRLERQEHTNGRVEHLAELYAEHQSQTAIVGALDKEKEVLRRTMLDDGASGISAYYGLIKEVEQAKSKRDGAGRKIINWLELCGHKKDQPRKKKQTLASLPKLSEPMPTFHAPVQVVKREKPRRIPTPAKEDLLLGVGDE